MSRRVLNPKGTRIDWHYFNQMTKTGPIFSSTGVLINKNDQLLYANLKLDRDTIGSIVIHLDESIEYDLSLSDDLPRITSYYATRKEGLNRI